MLEITFDRSTMLRVDLLAPEIQEAVAQPLLFGNLLRAGHLKRQHFGGRQHLEPIGHHLDAPGRQRRVDVLVGARDHLARHADDALELDGFGGLERVRVGREHDLRDAVVIAQVDEQQIAVVALAMHPAGDTDVLPDMLGTQLVVLVRAVLVAFCHVILKARGASPARLRPLALALVATSQRSLPDALRFARYALARASCLELAE